MTDETERAVERIDRFYLKPMSFLIHPTKRLESLSQSQPLVNDLHDSITRLPAKKS